MKLRVTIEPMQWELIPDLDVFRDRKSHREGNKVIYGKKRLQYFRFKLLCIAVTFHRD